MTNTRNTLQPNRQLSFLIFTFLLLLTTSNSQQLPLQNNHRKLLATKQQIEVFLLVELKNADCKAQERFGIVKFERKWDELLGCASCTSTYRLAKCNPSFNIEIRISDRGIGTQQLQNLVNTIRIKPECMKEQFSEFGEIEIFVNPKTSDKIQIPSRLVKYSEYDEQLYPMIDVCSDVVEITSPNFSPKFPQDQSANFSPQPPQNQSTDQQPPQIEILPPDNNLLPPQTEFESTDNNLTPENENLRDLNSSSIPQSENNSNQTQNFLPSDEINNNQTQNLLPQDEINNNQDKIPNNTAIPDDEKTLVPNEEQEVPESATIPPEKNNDNNKTDELKFNPPPNEVQSASININNANGENNDGDNNSNRFEVWIVFLAVAIIVIAAVILVLALVRRKYLRGDVEAPKPMSAGRTAAYLARAEQYGYAPVLR